MSQNKPVSVKAMRVAKQDAIVVTLPEQVAASILVPQDSVKSSEQEPATTETE